MEQSKIRNKLEWTRIQAEAEQGGDSYLGTWVTNRSEIFWQF